MNFIYLRTLTQVQTRKVFFLNFFYSPPFSQFIGNYYYLFGLKWWSEKSLKLQLQYTDVRNTFYNWEHLFSFRNFFAISFCALAVFCFIYFFKVHESFDHTIYLGKFSDPFHFGVPVLVLITWTCSRYRCVCAPNECTDFMRLQWYLWVFI